MSTTFDERLVLDKEIEGNIIYNEHLVRYELAGKFVKNKTVLDIACGSGYGSRMLAEAGAAKVISMDASALALECAKKNYPHPNIEFRMGDAENIGLEEKTIDVVVSFETIEHLSNGEKFLAEAARVLKDDGVIIISTPNKAVSKEKNPYHFKEYDKDEFREALIRFFPTLVIMKQYDAMASLLRVNEEKTGQIMVSSHSAPSFFVALGSKTALPDIKLASIASLNPVALSNLYDNPAIKLMNAVYSFLFKIPGMKMVFKLLRKLF